MPHCRPDKACADRAGRRRPAADRWMWLALRCIRRAPRPPAQKILLADETGSAVVEFVFLGVLLLVPVVYLVLTVGQLQGGSFAVVGAADQAAKVFVDAPTLREADARARAAAGLALSDFGFAPEQAVVEIGCSTECLTPGSTVTVVVRLEVPLPLIPTIGGTHTSAATVDSTSTQIVERFG